MDFPMEVVGSQLTLEWEALMQALWEGLAGAGILAGLAVALGGIVMASCRTRRPQRFWCPSTGRDVEVLVEEWGPPRFRQTLRVVQCSVFEPGAAITCRRACRDTACRRLSPPFGLAEALPAYIRA
jgi:hypothetical protein